MIDKKLVLYVLLGFLAFALWSAWQKDFNQGALSTNQASREINQKGGFLSNIIGSSANHQTTKDQSVLSTTNNHDLSTPEDRIINIRTDIFDISIDKLGGNIVRAGLLKQPNVIYQKEPFRLLDDSDDRYYVVQSGFVIDNKPSIIEYTSAKQEYVMQPGEKKLAVQLIQKNPTGAVITKSFVFTKNSYDFEVNYEVDNKSSDRWVGQFYSQIKRKNFGAKKGIFDFNTYTGASISSQEIPYEKISFSKIENITKNKKEFIRESVGGWVAMQQRYFLSAWIPNQEQVHKYFGELNNDVYTIGFINNPTIILPGKTSGVNNVLYLGPEIAENLAPLAKGLDRTVDYGWLWVISVAFFWILKQTYKIIGNWGWSIVVVTIFIKLLFYKLSESSCRSMAKMRTLMPKMQAIKEKYAGDRQKIHQATMDLYKKEKINPLNLGGCLPMLIQIPFFIALYYVLISAVELRHAPFVFWINDLSSPDRYYVLPILMGLSMFLQQKLTPTSTDPAQAKAMMFMPIIFTVFFLNFPSGLVLYWLVNNLFSVLQQWYFNRKISTVANV